MQPPKIYPPVFAVAVTQFSLSRLQHHSGAPSYFGGPLGSRLKGPLTAKGARGSASSDDMDGILTLMMTIFRFFFFLLMRPWD